MGVFDRAVRGPWPDLRGGSGDVQNVIGRVGSGPVGSRSIQNLTSRVGSGQEVFKSRGSGQVGSRVIRTPGVESGHFFPNFTGRVGSGRVKT